MRKGGSNSSCGWECEKNFRNGEVWVARLTRIGKMVLVVLLAWAGTQLDPGTAQVTVSGPAASVLPVPFAVFGPYSTRANDGYEGSNAMSPVVPSSYTAFFPPRTIGIQFISDSPRHLAGDGLSIALSSPHGPVTTGPMEYQSDGFAGVLTHSPLAPGRYRVLFRSPGFQTAQSAWNLTVRSLPARQQAAERACLVPALAPAYLATLNAERQTLGEAAVQWNASLAWAAAAHALYVQRNGYDAPSFHLESAKSPDFTGLNPWDRDMAFGWDSPLDGEVGIEWTKAMPAAAVIQNLVDTVYHRLSLLSPNVLAVGAGQSTGATGAVVMDLGYGYRAHLPLAITYPASGQAGVPTGWTDMESPDPVPGGFSRKFGYPVTVDFPTVQQLEGVHAELSTAGKAVAIYLDSPGVGGMADNQLGIVPRRVLFPDTTYAVKVSAQALFNSQVKKPVALRWYFSTGATDQSVAVDPVTSGEVAVSVVHAGSGRPVAGDLVRIYQVGSDSRLSSVAEGITDAKGMARCSVKRPARRSLFEAVAGGGTSMQFWW